MFNNPLQTPFAQDVIAVLVSVWTSIHQWGATHGIVELAQDVARYFANNTFNQYFSDLWHVVSVPFTTEEYFISLIIVLLALAVLQEILVFLITIPHRVRYYAIMLFGSKAERELIRQQQQMRREHTKVRKAWWIKPYRS